MAVYYYPEENKSVVSIYQSWLLKASPKQFGIETETTKNSANVLFMSTCPIHLYPDESNSFYPLALQHVHQPPPYPCVSGNQLTPITPHASRLAPNLS